MHGDTRSDGTTRRRHSAGTVVITPLAARSQTQSVTTPSHVQAVCTEEISHSSLALCDAHSAPPPAHLRTRRLTQFVSQRHCPPSIIDGDCHAPRQCHRADPQQCDGSDRCSHCCSGERRRPQCSAALAGGCEGGVRLLLLPTHRKCRRAIHSKLHVHTRYASMREQGKCIWRRTSSENTKRACSPLETRSPRLCSAFSLQV